MNKKNNRKGFTTVELVIVIAVIAILATVLIPTFSNLINKANDSAALQEASAVWKNYTIEHAQTFSSDVVYIQVGDKYFKAENGQLGEDYVTLPQSGEYILVKTANSTIGFVCAGEHDYADDTDTTCDVCGTTRTVDAG